MAGTLDVFEGAFAAGSIADLYPHRYLREADGPAILRAIDTPQGISRRLRVIREVDLPTFMAAHADGAVVVDVREPDEYLAGHVPGAKLLPMAGVPALLSDLPNDQPVFVICATGNRSLTAAGWMHAAGVDAYSVAGGTSGWIRMGRPVVAGPQENAA
jgi:rhodanese-related sulfurtransferase